MRWIVSGSAVPWGIENGRPCSIKCAPCYLQENALSYTLLPKNASLLFARCSMQPVIVPSPPSPPGIPSPIREALSSPLNTLFPFLHSPDYRNLPNFPLRQPPLSTHPHDSSSTSSTSVSGAYATFISNDNYLPGALVLAYCHQLVKSEYPFIILATPSLSQHARAIITKAGITLIDIESLVPAREQYDPSVTDSRFHETWTKLR